MRLLTIILLICSSMILLTACSNEKNTLDLKLYVANLNKASPPVLPPLPPFYTYEPYIYSIESDRSPFQIIPDTGELAIPDLQQFELSTIKMVGSVDFENQKWGLVKLPNGIIDRIGIGQILGTDYGKVTDISDDRIVVVEITTIAGRTLTKEIELPLSEAN